MSSEPVPDGHTTPDQHIQRAELLADLGQYEDAAGELANLSDVRALVLLARIRLAAHQPAEAIVAADAAVAAAPDDVDALVVRGMVLADLDRVLEAADTAERILRLGPDNGYAQTSAAGILGEVRNGQRALDAAWRGVQLTPGEANAHLVLGLVAARMELYDLAERAYREALELDPQVAEARHDVGIVRLEQRRYAEALERLAAVAPVMMSNVERRTSVGPGHLLHIGAGYALTAPIIVACAAGTGASRIIAGVLAVVGLVGLGLYRARGHTIQRSVTAGAVLAAPFLILLFALVGSPWLLAAAVAAGAVALLSTIATNRPR